MTATARPYGDLWAMCVTCSLNLSGGDSEEGDPTLETTIRAWEHKRAEPAHLVALGDEAGFSVALVTARYGFGGLA